MKLLKLLAATVSFIALSQFARATTADIQVQCHAPNNNPGATPWADETVEKQSSISPGYRDVGMDYYDGGDTESWCQLIVPADYNSSSGTHPSVLVYGYLSSCVPCCCGACSNTGHIKFKVSSRTEPVGYTIYESWGAESSITLNYSSQSCSADCLYTCYIDDNMDSFTADATNSASNWNAGDLVLIRIQRDTSVSNNLGGTFHAAGTIRLTYPK
jgi:hypothetical protein